HLVSFLAARQPAELAQQSRNGSRAWRGDDEQILGRNTARPYCGPGRITRASTERPAAGLHHRNPKSVDNGGSMFVRDRTSVSILRFAASLFQKCRAGKCES